MGYLSNIILDMKNIILAKDKEHLQKLVLSEIESNGNDCDLNHIDVSNVVDMSSLFEHLKFNGNISKWNVSSVVDMKYMFNNSHFNGDKYEFHV